MHIVEEWILNSRLVIGFITILTYERYDEICQEGET